MPSPAGVHALLLSVSRNLQTIMRALAFTLVSREPDHITFLSSISIPFVESKLTHLYSLPSIPEYQTKAGKSSALSGFIHTPPSTDCSPGLFSVHSFPQAHFHLYFWDVAAQDSVFRWVATLQCNLHWEVLHWAFHLAMFSTHW